MDMSRNHTFIFCNIKGQYVNRIFKGSGFTIIMHNVLCTPCSSGVQHCSTALTNMRQLRQTVVWRYLDNVDIVDNLDLATPFRSLESRAK